MANDYFLASIQRVPFPHMSVSCRSEFQIVLRSIAPQLRLLLEIAGRRVSGASSLPPLRRGIPTLGAALMLSGVLVFVVAVVRSGALSPSWLQRESPRTIRNATRRELSWAFLCAGLAVDALFGGVRAMSHVSYGRHDILLIVVLTVAASFVIGAGLFSTRWSRGIC